MEAFFRGFEKRASQHTEEMEKEAFVSKVIPWLGRTAGRVVGKFRGVARPKGGFAPIQGHVTRGATPKATATAIPGKTRRMSLGEQIHQAKGEYGAASRGMARPQWAAGKKELGGRDWASQRKQMLAQGEEVASAKDALRAERQAAKTQQQQTQQKPPETTTPEKPADQSMADTVTGKAKEGWEGTKKWWGELDPDTKTLIKGTGLVGGGMAAGHLLTRSGDNSKVSYGPSYGV